MRRGKRCRLVTAATTANPKIKDAPRVTLTSHMFCTDQTLPALLDASHYTSPERSIRDQDVLRKRTWQLIGCSNDLPREGAYVAVERLGVPLLVRREADGCFAYHNVCVHRGCRLASGNGNSPQIKCPYHGWQYGVDGRTRKIPNAKQFPKFERERYRLKTYPIRQAGQLIFVHLGRENAEDDEIKSDDSVDDLGPWIGELADRTRSDRWRMVMNETIDYPCDWKIPIEGSLESYHLDEVHKGTFGSAPSEEDCEHQLTFTGTVFETRARDASLLSTLESTLVKQLTGEFDPLYRHIHAFPNVMASLTDSLTLVYQITPMGLRSSRMHVWGFAPRSRQWGPLGDYFAWWLGKAAARMASRVLDEDAAIFPRVQLGLDAAISPRLFGRSEERLHAFHEAWLNSI